MSFDNDPKNRSPGPIVLDALALDKLRELDPAGTNGVVQRVLRAYEQSLSRLLAELEPVRQTRDLDTVARVAHTLKSSSASVGALALSRRCALAEKTARAGDATALDGELDSLLHEGALALDAVRAMLRP